MLKKTVHRPNHRERAQPVEREKWGVLEKHKDYSLRAKNYQEKKNRLQILRQKAAERNPDEFRYGMLSSKSNQGRKITDRGNPVLSHEAVRLLKTQDAGYLRTVIQQTKRAIEKLEQEFVLRAGQGPEILGDSKDNSQGQHLIFVDTEEEQKHYEPQRPAILPSTRKATLDQRGVQYPHLETEEHGTTSPTNKQKVPKSKRALQREEEALEQEKILRKKHEKEQNTRRAKLAALKVREKDLVDAERELDLQRAKMSNSIGGVTKAGVKWRLRERKK